MDDARHTLRELAATAVIHARQEHGIASVELDPAAADRILDREREGRDEDRKRSLGLVYGAWFGERIVNELSGAWVGLAEPVPPRVRIGGRLASPIEIASRRLRGEACPTLTDVWRDLQACRQVAARDADVESRNARAWDLMASDGRFVAPDDMVTELRQLDVRSALGRLDPWLRDEVSGRDVLCLAAGGGLHAPLLAIAGARVTVLDLSPRQLERDRAIAAQAGLSILTVLGAMGRLDTFADRSFDVVVQPVASCYVPDLVSVYLEVARVLRPCGLYVSQHKSPASLQASSRYDRGYRVRIPCEDGRLLAEPEAATNPAHREPLAAEFLHDLDALIGGLCRAGFVIEDLVEPPRGDHFAPAGTAEHRAAFLPPYLKIKARRTA